MTSIILVGPRCTGKTEKGKILAGIRNVPFVDADEVFKEDHGEIKEFVDSFGWQDFRRFESGTIYRIVTEYKGRDIVLTPGGGAVAHDQGEGYRVKNVRLLKDFGSVVYVLPFDDNLLHNSVELTCRLVTDPRSAGSRPKLLKEEDVKKAEEDKKLMGYLEMFISSYYPGKTNKPGFLLKAAYDAYDSLVLTPGHVTCLSLGGIFAITERDQLEDKFVRELVDMHLTLKKRDSLYRAAAHHVLYTRDITSEEAARSINDLVK